MEQQNNAQQGQGQVVEMQENEAQQAPDIYLDGLDEYKDIVTKLKNKLLPLVKDGHMSENVANRVVDDFSYQAFQQAVKVNYRQ